MSDHVKFPALVDIDGEPDTYDRAIADPNRESVVYREGKLTQGAEANEAQTILRDKIKRVGDLVATDGNRVEGGDILIDLESATATLRSGHIYIRGDVRAVPAAVLEDLPLVGDVRIGVRAVTTVITHEEDETLLGLHPGTAAHGEPGAAREVITLAWGRSDVAASGDFYSVYLVRNGTVIDQRPPPYLSGINQALAVYDRVNGPYVVEGCRVTALGPDGDGNQAFSIGEGEANIEGIKIVRVTSLRYEEPETPDLFEIEAEPHTFDDSGSGTAEITLNNSPIATVESVVIQRQKSETIVRGAVAGTLDLLSETSVSQIVSVTQGATTFVANTDYKLTADKVDWSPGGTEPAPGSSYQITFRYLDAVTPDDVTEDTVTVTGGVTGTPVQIAYTYKLPRIDRICLNQLGGVIYLKGTPARANPVAPRVPRYLLGLARVFNKWSDTPQVKNDAPIVDTVIERRRLYDVVYDIQKLFIIERSKSAIDRREPVAKRGIFADPLIDDTFRDQGETQTAAVFEGNMRLAIDPTFYPVQLPAPQTLPYEGEVIVRQEAVTGCMKLNPYASYTPPEPPDPPDVDDPDPPVPPPPPPAPFPPVPAKLTLTPSQDFWTEEVTVWLSVQTQFFGGGKKNGKLVNEGFGGAGLGNDYVRAGFREVLESEETIDARRMRPIVVQFKIEKFQAGERLVSLTFDGRKVTPNPLPTANGAGTITGQFTVPSSVSTGTKEVVAVGHAGTRATAIFTGSGTVTIERRRRIGLARYVDPLAQSFAVEEPRQLVGMDVKFCAFGDRLRDVTLELRDVDNSGYPDAYTVLGVSYVDMDAPLLNQWHPMRFPTPVTVNDDRQFAMNLMTDDPDHAVSIASLGAKDLSTGQYVTAQPYTVGVLFSSSNAAAYTAHQTDDMTARLVAAKYTATERLIMVGVFELEDASDLLVRAAIELPSEDCSCVFEVTFPDNSVVTLENDQNYEMAEFFTGTVAVRARLKGTSKLSPILDPEILVVAGSIRTAGTYVTRAFEIGTDTDIATVFKALLPAGSSVLIEMDEADDAWVTVPLEDTTPLADGRWVEREHKAEGVTADQGRLRVTLSGGPGARPMIADFGHTQF